MITKPTSHEGSAEVFIGLEADNNATQEELDRRFDAERIAALTGDFIKDEIGFDIVELRKTKKFIMCIVPAEGIYSDIGRCVETPKFAKAFKRPQSEVCQEYDEYAAVSTFLIAVDIQGEQPQPAGVVRIIEPNDTKRQKSINDLIEDTPKNPWIDEIKQNYFNEGEIYNPLEAWERLCARSDIVLNPSESHDVATIAVRDEYGTSGSIDGTSIALYHTCLRYALGNDIKNLVSIQDIIPLQFLQQFGDCFSFFDDIKPHPYGGPYDTIPAWAELQEGMRRVRSSGFGNVFIEGEGIDRDYLMVKDYMPGQYSDEVLHLGEFIQK